MDGIHHLLILVRPGYGEHFGIALLDHFRLGTQTACDDDSAIFGERFADRFKAFIAGRIEKAARVHEHEIRAGIIGRDLIAFSAQPRDDAF